MSKKTNTVTETVATAVVSEDTAVIESNLSEVQEQVLGETAPFDTVEPETVKYTLEDISILKAIANSESCPKEFFDERVSDVKDGRLSKEDFVEILGVEYDETEETTSEVAGIGHNEPPKNAVLLQIEEEMKQYKPKDATSSVEANDRVREVMNNVVEYIDDGETSLTSMGAIAIAEWISFNAGLVANGNKLLTVNSGMYNQVLDNMSSMVDSETAKDSSFRVRVGQMIKRAILIMDGKLSIGYFVLPADKKRVSAADAALPEYPNEIPEGAKVKRSTVIREGILVPQIPVIHPRTGEVTRKDDNSAATELRLVNNVATDALFAALWDRDGELQYHPLKGHILGFKTGKQLAEEEAKAKAEIARKAKESADAAKTRQTRGTQAENTPEANKDAVIAQQRDELATARQDASAAVEANKGDILSALNGLGAYIRDPNQKVDGAARTVLWRDSADMVQRRMIDEKVVPDKAEMLELARLVTKLYGRAQWDGEKGTWGWYSVEGRLLREYTLDDLEAA